MAVSAPPVMPAVARRFNSPIARPRIAKVCTAGTEPVRMVGRPRLTPELASRLQEAGVTLVDLVWCGRHRWMSLLPGSPYCRSVWGD